MITEHIMAPADPVERWHARNRVATTWLLIIVAAAYAIYSFAMRRSRQQLDAEEERDAVEADALNAAVELERLAERIAADRGRCACPTSTPCPAPGGRCMLCHRCGKVASLVKRPPAALWSPDSPERRALLQRQRDAIAANQPFNGGPL